METSLRGPIDPPDRPANGHREELADGVEQRARRTSRPDVIAAARRLGSFTMHELAAELGTTNLSALRQHVLGIRRAGNLIATGSGPSRRYEWTDDAAGMQEPQGASPPETLASDGRVSLALRLIDERLAWLEERKVRLTAARAALAELL